MVMVFYVFTSYLEPSFWDKTVDFLPPFHGDAFRLRHIVFLVMVLIFIRLVVENIYKQLYCGIGKNGKSSANTSTMSPIVPLGILFSVTWSAYERFPAILSTDPIIFCLLFGCCWAKVTNKMIVGHMSKTRIELIDRIFVGPCCYWVSCVYGEIADHLDINVFTIPYKQPETNKPTTGK